MADSGRQNLLKIGAFADYDKADAYRLSDLLAEDLVRFRCALRGDETVQGWMTDSHGGRRSRFSAS